MKPLVVHDGLVVPIPAANVDTDILMPRQYLKRVERSGLAPYLFDRWRYLDRGATGDDPYVDCGRRAPDPDFALNQPQFAGASILLAGANFGCGSSREQAVWALVQAGFRAVIAPSFGDIFFNNCFGNGLLPVVLDPQTVDALAQRARAAALHLRIDLPACRIEDPARQQAWPFAIDPFRQRCLIEGADAVALTLRHAQQIDDFERAHRARHAWLSQSLPDFS